MGKQKVGSAGLISPTGSNTRMPTHQKILDIAVAILKISGGYKTQILPVFRLECTMPLGGASLQLIARQILDQAVGPSGLCPLYYIHAHLCYIGL